MLKKIVSHCSPRIQQELRRFKCYSEIRNGGFRSNEPEFDQLSQWIGPGDWVLDIGANIGYYTLKCSSLVGPQGRVIAFEPILETAEMLCSCVRYAGCRNVTVLNWAVSDTACVLNFSVPLASSGIPNYFLAHAEKGGGGQPVYAGTVDQLSFPSRIALVKIDTEGAEASVIAGMEQTLRRDHPVLIIETDEAFEPRMKQLGYRMRPRAGRSSNLVFLPESAG